MCGNKMLATLLFFILFHCSSGIIYELSDEDYARMPKIVQLDDYEACLEDPQGLYCMAEFALVSDEPSPLLNMIQEYSEHYASHYNHSLLRHGICITRTCKQFYEVSEGDLGSALEACANESLYNEHKLKARVSTFECSKREKHLPIDNLDIAVAVLCVAILIANVVASTCDYFFGKGQNSGGLRYFYCFSIFRNWNKLMEPAAEGREPRLKRLIGLHGIRTLTMFLVVGLHSVAMSVILPENERFLEYLFQFGSMHILTCGTLIVQTFLMISSFLLVYNWLINSEKQKPSWKMLPNKFVKRWLRLTPSYALILALTATWFGRLTTGPNWKHLVGNEMIDCRRVWWKHLLYINNYENDAVCMLQSWYLAADTQLYYVAATAFVLCQTARRRKVVLSLLFVIAVAVPTLITYLRNLDGILMVYPELARSVFMNYPTFDEIYKRGHTNMTATIIGMVLGYWVYDLQKTGLDPKTLKKYRFLYWAMFPLGALCCYSGNIYYAYAPKPSVTVNLLYAALTKPAFAIFIGLIMVGAIFEFEGVYRTILEWPVWTLPSRLSFSVYLMHIAVIRNHMALQTVTHRMDAFVIIATGVMGIAASLVAGFFIYILVEGPFTAIVREWFSKPEPIVGSKYKDSKKKEDADVDGSKKKNGVPKLADNSARRRVFDKIVDKSTINTIEKNR